jgi:hypothetical protein
MLTMKKLILAALLASSAGQAVALDPEADRVPSASEVFLDAALVRPLGVVTLVSSAAVWVLSLPFTLPTRSVGKATDALLVTPFEHTFKRPVGQFATCEDRPDTCTAPSSDK